MYFNDLFVDRTDTYVKYEIIDVAFYVSFTCACIKIRSATIALGYCCKDLYNENRDFPADITTCMATLVITRAICNRSNFA